MLIKLGIYQIILPRRGFKTKYPEEQLQVILALLVLATSFKWIRF
jgi:hypothetical protein